MRSERLIRFAAIATLGFVLLAIGLTAKGLAEDLMLAGSVALLAMAAAALLDQQVKKTTIAKVLTFEFYHRAKELADEIKPKTLDEHTVASKQLLVKEIQREHRLPGAGAAQFSAMVHSNTNDLLIRPSAYPMTPMYLLDNEFRVLDWNEAFTVAFDRTMEGRKGRGVLEWTYFLDNYEEVLEHGVKVFGDAQTLPLIDVEDIAYTSLRYGKLTATKRAYRIPDDSGACLAWLVTLDLKFADPKQQVAYKQDLIRLLGLDLMWSEYAVSYDRVLNSTRIYPDLLDHMIGGIKGLPGIADDARIIDLGAGTGNLTYKLMTSGNERVAFAAENNRMMLEILRSKCQRFLRNDANASGVVAFKHDITSLLGLENGFFDCAIMNNVLYSVQDAEACLEEACRVLKPGGELRLSGPRKDTKIGVLFEKIHAELTESGRFEELESDYKHVLQINELKLGPWLYRWTTKEVERMILKAGFSKILYSTEDVYAGQSMLVYAQK